MTKPLVAVQNLHKSYQQQLVLQKVNLEIWSGDFLSIVGPSGAGKSTLLRILAGLEPPDHGSYHCCQQAVQQTPPRLGMISQSDTLFPWLNARDNVAFGLRTQGISTAHARAQAKDYLHQLNLTDAAHKYPHQLSGGMRQKVSLARTLITQPKLLLLDEPFAAVDSLTRQQLNADLVTLHRQQKLTTILVTHDLQEALNLGNKIAVLSGKPATLAPLLATNHEATYHTVRQLLTSGIL